MRQGLFFAPFDGLADPILLGELAALAETSGWDGVFLWDHLLYRDVTNILDPTVCLAAMATTTTRVALGTMVTPLARRRPAVVARQAVTLDLLSHGRLVLGFGLGEDGPKGELSSFGELTDRVERAGALTEGLEVLTALLSGEPVRHRGAHYLADDVTFLPTSPRTEGIPIWLASRWPNHAPLRRAARYDGVFTIGLDGPEDVGPLRDRVAEFGADLEDFDVVCLARPGDDPAPWADAGATWLLTLLGPYRLEADEVRAVVAAGPAVP